MALREKYGERVGFHYDRREDMGLFWSNDPATTISAMVRSIAARNSMSRSIGTAGCRIPRGGPAPDRRPPGPISLGDDEVDVRTHYHREHSEIYDILDCAAGAAWHRDNEPCVK
jgi:hypothetical protein